MYQVREQRDAFDVRDTFLAVDFLLLVFFLLLAAAFLAGMRIGSKTVQMKSAIIHALIRSGSLPSEQNSDFRGAATKRRAGSVFTLN